MERSDEKRRLDSLYDRLGSLERTNRRLEAEIKRFKREILAAGKLDFDWSVLERLDKLEEQEKKIERLKGENKKIKAKGDEIIRHVMWVALEFGKVLQERVDLRKELQALKGGAK